MMNGVHALAYSIYPSMSLPKCWMEVICTLLTSYIWYLAWIGEQAGNVEIYPLEDSTSHASLGELTDSDDTTSHDASSVLQCGLES